MEEYFVAIRIEFSGARRTPHDKAYADRAADFYWAVSELLGAGNFDSPMSLLVNGVETYVYLDAESPTEAATNAERLLSEAAERTWGPGTTVAAERVITAEERDRELASEGVDFG